MKWKLPLASLLPVLPPDLAEELKSYVEKDGEVAVHRRVSVDKGKPLDPGNREVLQYVSTRDIDRDAEILAPDGAVLSEFRKAPQVLWGHDYSIPPIGSDREISSDGYGVRAVTRYAETDLANDVWSLRRDGHLNTSSVGFVPLEWTDRAAEGWKKLTEKLSAMWDMAVEDFEQVTRVYTKWLLLEHSDVSVPANINALTIQVGQEAADERAAELEALITKGAVKTVRVRQALDKTRRLVMVHAGQPLANLKPYPNEHSCRLREPGDFIDDSFRRYSRESDGKKYSVIAGKLEGGDGSMIEQSYRYPTDDWGESEARSHCEGHDGIKFEPASGEESRVLRIESQPRRRLLTFEEQDAAGIRDAVRTCIMRERGCLS